MPSSARFPSSSSGSRRLSKTGHVTPAAERHFLLALSTSSRGDPQIFFIADVEKATLAFLGLLGGFTLLGLSLFAGARAC